MNSTLTVSRHATLSSTLNVTKTQLHLTMRVWNNATFDKEVDIKGNLIVDGDLSVRQTNSIMNTVVNNYEVIITNDLSLNGDLVVSGDASFNSSVDICGNLYAQYPDSSIPLSALNGSVSIDTNADLSLNADAYFKGKLSVFSDVSLNGDSVPIPGTDLHIFQ